MVDGSIGCEIILAVQFLPAGKGPIGMAVLCSLRVLLRELTCENRVDTELGGEISFEAA